MNSVPNTAMEILRVENEHLARALGFPDDLPLWEGGSYTVELTRNQKHPSGGTTQLPAGTYTVRSVMAEVEDLDRCGLQVDMPMIRAESSRRNEKGILRTFDRSACAGRDGCRQPLDPRQRQTFVHNPRRLR